MHEKNIILHIDNQFYSCHDVAYDILLFQYIFDNTHTKLWDELAIASQDWMKSKKLNPMILEVQSRILYGAYSIWNFFKSLHHMLIDYTHYHVAKLLEHKHTMR